LADAEDEDFDYWWMEGCIVGGIDWDNFFPPKPDYPDPESIEYSELAKKIAG